VYNAAYRRDPKLDVRRSGWVGAGLDFFWWCLAAGLGVLAAASPRLLLPPTTDAVTRAVFLNGAFVIVGMVLGALKPQRAWRWGVASILALPLADAIRLGANPNLATLPTEQLVSAFLNSMPDYVTRSVPAGAGAYLGAYLVARGM